MAKPGSPNNRILISPLIEWLSLLIDTPPKIAKEIDFLIRSCPKIDGAMEL